MENHCSDNVAKRKKLYLTRGFDGDVLTCLGEFETEDEFNSLFSGFKDDCVFSYRFNPFHTVTSMKDGGVIDFGDYSHFLRTKLVNS